MKRRACLPFLFFHSGEPVVNGTFSASRNVPAMCAEEFSHLYCVFPQDSKISSGALCCGLAGLRVPNLFAYRQDPIATRIVDTGSASQSVGTRTDGHSPSLAVLVPLLPARGEESEVERFFRTPGDKSQLVLSHEVVPNIVVIGYSRSKSGEVFSDSFHLPEPSASSASSPPRF